MAWFSRKTPEERAAEQQQRELENSNREIVLRGLKILQEYKAGKQQLEGRIVENEEWYKQRHWAWIGGNKRQQTDVQPTSAWLFNAIENKHADAMDNYPEPNVLPREQGDKMEAKKLSSILPVILERNGFEETYASVWHDVLIGGTGVYAITWDPAKDNIGDISIQPADILSLYWEPGVRDLQDSQNLFYVTIKDNDVLMRDYPQLTDKILHTPAIQTAKYVYDDSVSTDNKSALVDWYYRKHQNGRVVTHLIQFVNDTLLYSSEQDTERPTVTQVGPDGLPVEVPTGPSIAETGVYAHGMYPFEMEALFPLKGTPAGFGYVDIGKSAQEYIDRIDQAILQNTLCNAKPRFFIRTDGSVNEEEYADFTKDFVHVDGNLGDDSVRPITHQNLSGTYVSIRDGIINQLKETTGNRDVATGGTTGGVTAASAIAAMQEASGKLSRDHIKASYRVFRRICVHMIELIRQYYTAPRTFRILGEGGQDEYTTLDNSGIMAQQQIGPAGEDMGLRIPEFDVSVSAQKQSPYSKMAQNELALQLYGAGFFAPQNADPALACLNMMDFSGKEDVIQTIQRNQTLLQMVQALQQQVVQLASIVDAQNGTDLAAGAAAGMMGAPQPAPGEVPQANVPQESGVTSRAREEAAARATPR